MPPIIDKEKCTGCGICIFECGASVFAFKSFDRRAYAKTAKNCVHCFICQPECPTAAITVKYPQHKARTKG